jgi:hypothetical protein
VGAHAVAVFQVAEADGEHLPGERVVLVRRAEGVERRGLAERASRQQPRFAVLRAALVAERAGGREGLPRCVRDLLHAALVRPRRCAIVEYPADGPRISLTVSRLIPATAARAVRAPHRAS